MIPHDDPPLPRLQRRPPPISRGRRSPAASSSSRSRSGCRRRSRGAARHSTRTRPRTGRQKRRPRALVAARCMFGPWGPAAPARDPPASTRWSGKLAGCCVWVGVLCRWSREGTPEKRGRPLLSSGESHSALSEAPPAPGPSQLHRANGRGGGRQEDVPAGRGPQRAARQHRARVGRPAGGSQVPGHRCGPLPLAPSAPHRL